MAERAALGQTAVMTSGVEHSSTPALEPGPLRRVVAVLCITEIVSWGILFYAFPVLSTTIRDTEGWSLTWLVACFTAAQLVAAAAGLWVGRHIDAYGPRRVMTAGSILGVLAVVAIASAPTLWLFLLAWLIAGVAMSGTLYAPAFAAVTGWAGDQRVRALTAVTLVAGLASTVFAPLTAVLVDHLSWRQTYAALTVVLIGTIPLHWWGLRAPWTSLTAPAESESGADHARRRVVHQPEFVLLVAAMTLGGFCVYAVVVNLVPLLTQHGLSTTAAAVALGIGGAGQVAGRLFYGPALTRFSARTRTVATLAAASLTTLALAVVHQPVAVVCALSFGAGIARGIFTLIQATSVSDRWGTQDFGARNGILSGAVLAAAAFAPWAGTLLASALGSYAWAFVVLAIGCLMATALVRPHARYVGGPGARSGHTGATRQPKTTTTCRCEPTTECRPDLRKRRYSATSPDRFLGLRRRERRFESYRGAVFGPGLTCGNAFPRGRLPCLVSRLAVVVCSHFRQFDWCWVEPGAGA